MNQGHAALCSGVNPMFSSLQARKVSGDKVIETRVDMLRSVCSGVKSIPSSMRACSDIGFEGWY